jgi:hypothetical protein
MKSNVETTSPLPRGFVPATAEETRETKQEAEVVPGSAVMYLVNVEIALEQRDQEDKRRNESVPEPEPEARDTMIARRFFGRIRARCTTNESA